jgi:surface antigen
MTGNAYEWLGEAQSAGWSWGTLPPQGYASIICLQAGVQGAGGYGHVGVVESINSDGSVRTSNYDWSPNIGNSVVTYVTFSPGRGVSFLWLSNAANIPVGQKLVNTVATALQGAGTTFSLASNATVATTLSAFDSLFALDNPFIFDTSGIQDSVLGVSFTDPAKWLMQFGVNVWNDFRAISLRLTFLFLGVYVLFKVLDHFLDISGTVSKVANQAKSLAPLFM